MSISIEGIEELIRRVGLAQTVRILRPPMWRSVARIVRFMADYPPRPAGTRYQRGKGMANAAGVVTRFTSEVLGESWTQEVEESETGLMGRAGNNASYGPFVQSAEFQARWMGHWQTDEDAVEELTDPIEDDFEAAIQGALNGTVG